MRKDEIRKIIHEVIEENGFLKSLGAFISPTSAFKSAVSKGKKSKKYQTALKKFVDFVMGNIVKKGVSYDDVISAFYKKAKRSIENSNPSVKSLRDFRRSKISSLTSSNYDPMNDSHRRILTNDLIRFAKIAQDHR